MRAVRLTVFTVAVFGVLSASLVGSSLGAIHHLRRAQRMNGRVAARAHIELLPSDQQRMRPANVAPVPRRVRGRSRGATRHIAPGRKISARSSASSTVAAVHRDRGSTIVAVRHGVRLLASGSARRPAGAPHWPAMPRKLPVVRGAGGLSVGVVSPLPSSASDSEGDTLTISYVSAGQVPTDGTEDCSNTPMLAGARTAFCGYTSFYDSIGGSTDNNANFNNAQSDTVYDACGTEVGSGSTTGWRVYNGNWSSPISMGSEFFWMPYSGYCSGTWTVVYTWGQKFDDKQWLGVGTTATFQVTMLTPAPPSAYGEGNGQASRYDPTCGAADPVNCASGDLFGDLHRLLDPGARAGAGSVANLQLAERFDRRTLRLRLDIVL
jgi:hypothetical protein